MLCARFNYCNGNHRQMIDQFKVLWKTSNTNCHLNMLKASSFLCSSCVGLSKYGQKSFLADMYSEDSFLWESYKKYHIIYPTQQKSRLPNISVTLVSIIWLIRHFHHHDLKSKSIGVADYAVLPLRNE